MDCSDLATGERCKDLDRLPPGAARDKIELAATLVGAVAGVRPPSGPDFPERTTKAWLELERRLEMATRAASAIGSRIPRIRDPRLALAVARGLDLLLCNIAVGHNALELAIGDGLAALEIGRRAMDLKYSNIGDYAREELGLNASTAAKTARLARKLRDRPLVRNAVRRGEISLRKAETIAPVAVGDRQGEWILRAKTDPVRALAKVVRAPRDDEEWVTATAAVPAEKQAVIREGLRWGGIIRGHRSTKAERVEAWAQEYYGAHPAPPEDDDGCDDVELKQKCESEIDSLKERLERETRLWADLVKVDPLEAVEFSGEIDPWRIDAELKRFVEMRNRWDEVFGFVAALFNRCRAWERLEFVDFGQYCEERLGMAKRTVLQRVALERALVRIPLLRQALRERRISYEKARVIARHWDTARPNEMRPLLAMAETMTCVDLREALTEKSEEQMCARGAFTLTAPRHVIDLLKATLRMARALAKRAISLGTCLSGMAGHFIEVWKAHVKERMTKRNRIFARDRHRCQVPGCSRRAVHQHHIEFVSQGGSDDDSNKISLCAAHHLFGIHEGRMRVTGRAPDALVWEFGLRRSWAHTAVP